MYMHINVKFGSSSQCSRRAFSDLPLPFCFILDRFILADGFAVFHRNLSLVCSHFFAFPVLKINKEGGGWELVFNGYRGSVGEDEKFWR